MQDNRIGLATHTSLGCTIDNYDYLFEIDHKSIPNIYTKQELTKFNKGIKAARQTFIRKVVKFIRVYRETKINLSNIQADIDKLNSKYSNLEYGHININNPFTNHIEKAMLTYKLTAHIAILSLTHSKLYNLFIIASEYFRSLPYMDTTCVTIFGAKYRDESVFERAIFHYNDLQSQLKEQHADYN